ncbi:HEAT repeat domain-containing protein [Nostoc sp.]|uniref:HEAT repeat domain-containing protein n=1 Tax=Nostoc sp. TaxID=1180 RepID=UPI002FF561F5
MIVEWFTLWIGQKTVGFLVKTIISEEFVKDLVKDYAKDFFKYIFNNTVTAPFKREPLEKAVVMAVTEFLQLMQQDLDDSELAEDEIKKYEQPLNKFLKYPEVKEIFGTAFKDDSQAIDTKKLEVIWYDINASFPLPDDFNWKRIARKYLQKVKEIILEVPELREILDSRNLDKIRDNTTEIAGIIPDFDLERYQEAIKETYSNLNLDSLDTSTYDYRDKLKVWDIFIAQNVREIHQVIPRIHELPKEHLRKLRETNELEAEVELEELERYKRVYLEQPKRSVVDIVNEQQTYKYIVILGDPGSGKSTLLKYLALNWARSSLNNSFSLPIPVLIELRTYMRRREDKECDNFLEFFHKCSGAISHLNQHQLHEQLKSGKALVMFDGLDEVFDPAQREDVIIDIHRFTNEYRDVQVIVTSRVIGYKPQRLRDAEFHHFILQDLEPEQIQDFIYRWHELTFLDTADKVRKRERLQIGIDTSQSIAELAGNPLLLTMMAILNRNQELPRDRAELYYQASRVLLHQWDVERALQEDKRLDPKTIDYKDKQAMLRQVAYHMQTGDKGLAGNLISAGDLEKILTDYLKSLEVSQARELARVMINQLRTRNFILCFLGADYYAFVHRTFLEYFCAWEFVWQFEKERSITIEDLNTEVFGKHWQDETWHEVLLLIAGMIDVKFVGEILDYLMVQDGEEKKFINLFLAAGCLAEVRNRSVIVSTANKLLDKLKDLTKYDLWYYYESYDDEEETELVQEIRTQAVATVATIWKDNSDTLHWLKDRASADDENVRYAAIEALVSNFKDDPDTRSFLKNCATADDDENVRYAAIEALVSNFKDDPDTRSFLKDRASADDDENVRYAAIEALVSNFKDDPDTRSFVKDCATANNEWDVRGAAIQALASNFKDYPDTRSILKEITTADDETVRYAAIEALAIHFKDDLDTHSILKDRATADESRNVRRVAIEALASNSKDHPDTHSFLKDRATADDETVRRVVIQALASNFKDHPDTHSFLKDRATADDDENVRYAAIEALASNFKDHPDTHSFLKDRATADDKTVRYAAIQALASNFKDHLDTHSILKDCATADESRNVRRVAIEALASNFKDHLDTHSFLKDRATADDDETVRRVAIQALASNFKDHLDTHSFLKDRATADDKTVRYAAIQALASNFKDDPDTHSVLKDCATADNEWYVRYVAIEALASNFKDDPDTCSFLREHATDENDEDVRYVAIEALASNFKDDPDTRSFLRELATDDNDGDVRYVAIEALAKYFRNQPELFEIYYNCAVNDSFEREQDYETNPRRIALEIIIKQFPQHPQTLPLLRDKAENDPDEQVRKFAQEKLKQWEE